MNNPRCVDCNVQLYGEWIQTPQCRACRLKHSPMTREILLQGFMNLDNVSDGRFHYWMNTKTGQISGRCSEGTCDFEYNNIDDFLKDNDLKDLEIV